MKLVPGQRAPDFIVRDMRGELVRLRDYTNDKVLLCFFRYAGCPFCNLSLHRLIRHHASLQADGLKIVAFFQSSAPEVEHFIMRRHKPPFPIVADPGRSIYELYGVEASIMAAVRTAAHLRDFLTAAKKNYRQPRIDGDFFLAPASFLIDPNMTVRVAHYARHFSDTFSFEEIRDFLDAPVRDTAAD